VVARAVAAFEDDCIHAAEIVLAARQIERGRAVATVGEDDGTPPMASA
jgi:hypothetical protein